MRHRIFITISIVLALLPNVSKAQWIPEGVPICKATDAQISPLLMSDGAGGFIIGWSDWRNGGIYHADTFIQKIDASGVVQWTTNGIGICTANLRQSAPIMVTDGSGGLFLFWNDERLDDYVLDTFAQHIDADGNALWTDDGMLVCNAPGQQAMRIPEQAAVADGFGGAIVVWGDERTWPNFRIRAQRLDAQGNLMWAADGVEAGPHDKTHDYESQWGTFVLADGTGGALIVWMDSRNSVGDIYAQRLDAAGVRQWEAGGVVVCDAPAGVSVAGIVPDGAGGFIVVWDDGRTYGHDVYAQRVNSAGVRQWADDGVPVCADAGAQTAVSVAEDGAGGALVAWQDGRSLQWLTDDVYAQRIDANGVAQWTQDGVPVSIDNSPQETPKITTDGNGGAIVSWAEIGTSYDIFSQRLSAAGTPLWGVEGIATCTAGDQQIPAVIIPDGSAAAVVVWTDNRDGNLDIYAQRVTDPATTVAITSFEATSRDGVVLLRGAFRSDLVITRVAVYRGVNGGALLPLALVAAGDRAEFVYEDRSVTPPGRYDYQIGVQDPDGEFMSPIATVVVDRPTLELAQNRPNPFNPSTTIHFVLPDREHVTLAIYDTRGVKVRTLVEGERGRGSHDLEWDGRDQHGAVVRSGVYFYRLSAGKESKSKKMILLK